MKKKILKICSVTLLLAMMLSLNSYASSGSGSVTVPTSSVYVVGKYDVSRSGNYSYVNVLAQEIKPTSASTEDTYTKCKTVLYSQNIMVSNEVVLTEGIEARVPMRESYLYVTYFNLCFAGNNPNLRAVVRFYYDGK